MFNSIDYVFSLPPFSTQMKIPGRTGPGLSRIMQFGSGRFVVKDGMVLHLMGAQQRAESKIASQSGNLAKTLPLQLHRNG